MLNVRFFPSSGDAYDACQCDETLTNGTLLVIRSESVVGVAYTWPFAVDHDHAGKLHTMKADPLSEANLAADMGMEPETLRGIMAHGKRLLELFSDKPRAFQARETLRSLGITLRRDSEWSEYRVNFAGGEEATRYHTTDLKDAIDTGLHMAEAQATATVPEESLIEARRNWRAL